jgi:hypothetical protein
LFKSFTEFYLDISTINSPMNKSCVRADISRIWFRSYEKLVLHFEKYQEFLIFDFTFRAKCLPKSKKITSKFGKCWKHANCSFINSHKFYHIMLTNPPFHTNFVVIKFYCSILKSNFFFSEGFECF